MFYGVLFRSFWFGVLDKGAAEPEDGGPCRRSQIFSGQAERRSPRGQRQVFEKRTEAHGAAQMAVSEEKYEPAGE